MLVCITELPEVIETLRTVSGAAGSGALLPCALRTPARLAVRVSPATPPPDRRVYGSNARTHAQPPTLKLNVNTLLHSKSNFVTK